MLSYHLDGSHHMLFYYLKIYNFTIYDFIIFKFYEFFIKQWYNFMLSFYYFLSKLNNYIIMILLFKLKYKTYHNFYIS